MTADIIRPRIRTSSFANAGLGVVVASVAILYGLAWNDGHKKMTRQKLAPDAAVAVPMPLPPDERLRPASPHGLSASTVAATFERAAYTLDEVADGSSDVPQLSLPAFPNDLRHVADIDARKSVFIRLLLPLVLEVNAEIAAQRERLLAIKQSIARGEVLDGADSQWLTDLAVAYRLDPSASVTRLLRRVDIVPPSLALAQSATESGWGMSKYAHHGNALFGQWGNGEDESLPASRRAIEKTHNLKTFNSPMDAVRAYVRNLNTHPAYDEFRLARSQMRSRGQTPDGPSLAMTLENYAEMENYVKALRQVMRGNALRSLDGARLASDRMVRF